MSKATSDDSEKVMSRTKFRKLNDDWNAEPNSPSPLVVVAGSAVVLEFELNHMIYPRFHPDQRARLRFEDAWRYRLGPTNDEGWFRGQCRFSKLAPEWGEFYEISGDLLLQHSTITWVMLSSEPPQSIHYLFYLRDETFECDASRWSLEILPPPDQDTPLPT